MKISNTKLMPIDLVEKKTQKQVQGDTLSDCHSELVSESKKRKGFTLAEVLITLTILGVVAALTIPSVMRTQNEAAERNKIKKAIVDYEKLISNMTIENDLTSIEALKKYANNDNCKTSRTYFKIKQDDTSTPANNCIFQTSNGVWWNVTDITRPVISTKGVENLSTADGENSFLLTTTYSDTARAFIVDDLSSSQLADEEKAQLKKTLAFAKIIEAKSLSAFEQTCTKVDDKTCTMSLGTHCDDLDYPERINCTTDPITFTKKLLKQQVFVNMNGVSLYT